jgi:flagellum-specific peptidoglycan hydrolase FlgJ
MYLPADFFKQFGNSIIEACQGTPIFPSVKAAQMALETGYGKSKVGNNMFGIKASGAHSPYWSGRAQTAKTTEVIEGKAGTYNLAFREYNSISDSIRDHSYFLLQNPRYRKAGVFGASTPEQQAKALQAAGYATDPGYADKLIQIINRYGLKSLDEKKKRMKKIELTIAVTLLIISGYFLYKNFR